MGLARASLVCASRAGVEPKISIMKGTITHSIIITTFFVQLTPLGRGGRIVRLKIIQVKLVPRVKLSNNPVILGRL